MNPTRVTARDYGSYADIDVTFPTGVTSIVGANGAGKSTLVGVIDVALFGGRLGELVRDGADAMEVALEFEHAGGMYRVRRTCQNGAGKVDFERRHLFPPTSPWEPLTRESVLRTNMLIIETIGLDRRTFRASSFLRQNEAGTFAESDARDRKQMLADVLGLGVWERLLDRTRADLRNARDETMASVALLAQFNKDLAARPAIEAALSAGREQRAIAEGDEAAAEAVRDAAAKALMAARTTATELSAAKRMVNERRETLALAQENQVGINAALSAEPSLRNELAEFVLQAARIPELEHTVQVAREQHALRQERDRVVDEVSRLHHQVTATGEAINKLSTKLAALDDAPSVECDRCGQMLGGEARDRASASYQAEVEALTAQASEQIDEAARVRQRFDELTERLQQSAEVLDPALVDTQLAQARAADGRAAEIRVRLERIDELKAERDQMGDTTSAAVDALRDAEKEVERIEAGLVVPVESLAADLASADAKLRATRDQLADAATKIAVAKAQLVALDEAAESADRERETITRLHDEVDLLHACEKAFGRDGVPALILENTAIPQIEIEAQRILSRLGGTTAGAQVELRTQRETQSGKLREVLDIVITAADGTAREYGNWSGGEKMRISLALRLALAQLLANRRAEVGVFVLDEPGDLDEAGKAALVDLLGEIHQRGIPKVFLVSHDTDLRDAFDQSLRVVNEDGASRVEGALSEGDQGDQPATVQKSADGADGQAHGKTQPGASPSENAQLRVVP